MRLFLKIKYNIQPPVNNEKEYSEPVSKVTLGKTGRFITLSGITTVSRSGKKLIARLPSGTFLMHPCKDDWFTISLLILGVIPVRLKQLSKPRLSIQMIRGEKILV